MKNAQWRDYLATEKQIRTLRKMGIDFEEGITKGEASDLLSSQFGMEATNKQKWFILRHGLHNNPELLTKYEANEIIYNCQYTG